MRLRCGTCASSQRPLQPDVILPSAVIAVAFMKIKPAPPSAKRPR